MHQGLPHDNTIRTAIALATRAPSVHNTQPWLFRLGRETVHLYADPSRQLLSTDPQGRDLLMSCGAALHHLRVAFAALGWKCVVHRLPNPDEPDHLAAIELVAVEITDGAVRAAGMIDRRHTDRRRYSSLRPSDQLLATLTRRCAGEDVDLRPVVSATNRKRLILASQEAVVLQANDPDCLAELWAWSGMHVGATSGVPAASIPRAPAREDMPARPFWGGELIQPDEAGHEPDGEVLAVLGTVEDDRLARLRTGEALSAVLLAATEFGLASCPLSHVFEVGVTREFVYRQILGQALHPQVLVRLGWPPVSGAPLLPTPRRPIDEVVSYQEL
jgi:nitroreductase